MKFYNTQTREKETFETLVPGEVKMYACGPTVYNFFHIGNARCFVVFDLLRRYLAWRGYKVTFVQNFTDVDDKIIKKANEEGCTSREVSERYIAEYFTDAKGLGIEPATIHPLATDNIDEIIDIVSVLIEKGHAYAVNGDVYFRTTSFPAYGKLSHIAVDDLKSGARIEVGDIKENPLDFALWKAAKPGEPYWESPWGHGRPGWHIECSAMTRRYLGEQIDIHCGGMDLTFPHHENEIAQSEAASGKEFVRYWLHNGYINVDNEKMSKSKNNFFTVRDVSKVYGYAPIRFFLLSAHYRNPVNYTADILEQAKASLERIYNCEDSLNFYLTHAPETGDVDEEAARQMFAAQKEKFIAVMDDDFNTADGISVIFDLVREINLLLRKQPSLGLMTEAKALFDELVGLMGFLKPAQENNELVQEIEAAIAARAKAKKEKNWAEADRIRAELAARGITLQDTPNGTKYTIAQ